uniref:Uncharacterized protein n=1 Tax=Setaria digitata TaxID=48799 RepID=A0A915PZK0_9BILA
MLILLIFPAVTNFCSLAILLITIVHVRQLKSVTEAITSSTHWLARTANRVGLGVSAHKALVEYAKRKNLMKLILHNEIKEKLPQNAAEQLRHPTSSLPR